MGDSADELIAKIQHLEAQVRASQDARAARAGVDRLKSAAQRMALKSHLFPMNDCVDGRTGRRREVISRLHQPAAARVVRSTRQAAGAI